MKKLYFAAILTIVTQMTSPKNNHYPFIGRSEDNDVKTNCENLNPAFLGISKDNVEKACDSIEARLTTVAKEQGYATQGFAFSWPSYLEILPSTTTKEAVVATRENIYHIQTIIGLPTVFEKPELENKAKKELQKLAKLLCDERAAQEKKFY